MNVNRVLHIRNDDAVRTFQDFLTAWWTRLELDAMLAPVEIPNVNAVSPRVISNPHELSHVNPFAPLMVSNTACMIQDFVKENPNRHLAVILRPCELRAVVELQKRRRVRYQPLTPEAGNKCLITIGVDCPGTFSRETYTEHATNFQEDAEMLRVDVAYGRQESYIPYEVRSTCQMCDSPGPFCADLTVGTIGIAPQGELLVIARDEQIDSLLRLDESTDGLATEWQVSSREMMVGKLVDKRTEKRDALMKSLKIEDLSSLMAIFARCTLCADCLDACPLYDGELAGMLGVGEARQNGRSFLYELVRVSRWLSSCSGCGMCRESCAQNVPLNQMITVMSHRIQNELHYRPGDPAQPLPWTVAGD